MPDQYRSLALRQYHDFQMIKDEEFDTHQASNSSSFYGIQKLNITF